MTREDPLRVSDDAGQMRINDGICLTSQRDVSFISDRWQRMNTSVMRRVEREKSRIAFEGATNANETEIDMLLSHFRTPCDNIAVLEFPRTEKEKIRTAAAASSMTSLWANTLIRLTRSRVRRSALFLSSAVDPVPPHRMMPCNNNTSLFAHRRVLGRTSPIGRFTPVRRQRRSE